MSTPANRFYCPVVFALLLAVACALLSGCSSSPSSGDGERAIRDRIGQESEGRIKLTKFQKSNGVEGTLAGFKIYALEFDAEIEFTENCKWLFGGFGQQLTFRTAKPPVQESGVMAHLVEGSLNPGQIVGAGQRIQLSGIVRFVKKEQGWAVEGVDLGNAKLTGGSSALPDSAGGPQPAVQNASRQRGAADGDQRGCVFNLRSLHGAIAVWGLEFRKSDNDTPTDADLFGPGKSIAKKPECPSGGTYQLGNVGGLPSCSVHGSKPDFFK